MGTITNNQTLSVFGYQEVTSPLGSAIAFNVGGNLVMVSYNLYEFTTLSDVVPPSEAPPGRIPESVTATLGKESQANQQKDGDIERSPTNT